MEYYKHNLNPILLDFGSLQVRWYGIMYLVGFVLGFFLLERRHRRGYLGPDSDQIQSLITYLILFMIVGSRTIYVTVYNPHYYLENPSEIIAIWQGGLSFHGAALGFVAAILYFCKKFGYGFFHIADNVALGSAQGYIFGRIGNFINGELYGRTTDVPWGVIFPQGGATPRHPSQLYQAFIEGFCILMILYWIEHRERKKGFAPPVYIHNPESKTKKVEITWKRTGVLGAWFLILYGIGRFIVEFFREPDVQLGFIFQFLTMGQILCVLTSLAGCVMLYFVIKYPKTETYTLKIESPKK